METLLASERKAALFLGANQESLESMTRDTRKEESHVIAPCPVYNLRQSFEEICATFAGEARATRVELTLLADDELPAAFWDMQSLRVRVFGKILSGIIAHTPAGGKVVIRIDRSSSYTICIRITNSGAPIPAEQKESMLHSRSGSLYNAYLCVQSHKGSIVIMDETEKSGNTFKIELPLYTLCMQ